MRAPILQLQLTRQLTCNLQITHVVDVRLCMVAATPHRNLQHYDQYNTRGVDGVPTNLRTTPYFACFWRMVHILCGAAACLIRCTFTVTVPSYLSWSPCLIPAYSS